MSGARTVGRGTSRLPRWRRVGVGKGSGPNGAPAGAVCAPTRREPGSRAGAPAGAVPRLACVRGQGPCADRGFPSRARRRCGIRDGESGPAAPARASCHLRRAVLAGRRGSPRRGPAHELPTSPPLASRSSGGYRAGASGERALKASSAPGTGAPRGRRARRGPRHAAGDPVGAPSSFSAPWSCSSQSAASAVKVRILA